MGVLRYHFGLVIPPGDTGMRIDGAPFTWEQGRGYCFDDTVPHAAWNRTPYSRMVILADVARDLPALYGPANRAVHACIQRTRDVARVAQRLAAEGIHVD